MPKGKGKKEEYKPLQRAIWMKLDKVTKGTVRYCETTASGANKTPDNAHFRTLYIRHEALFTDDDGELVIPDRLKVTISEE